MPYPLTQDKPFGDIDGDGEDEYTRTNDERLAVLAWYEAEYAKRFAEAGYENLTLVGFYWFREEVNSADSEDEERFYAAGDGAAARKGPQGAVRSPSSPPRALSAGVNSVSTAR